MTDLKARCAEPQCPQQPRYEIVQPDGWTYYTCRTHLFTITEGVLARYSEADIHVLRPWETTK